jgi:tetratricopeptide (TPR) repeat protein
LRRPAEVESLRRSRTPGLLAFGIFWFFITLSVESSVIPLKEVIAENRLYLPSVGAALAFGALLLFVARRVAAAAGGGIVGRVAVPVLVVLVIGSLSAATFLRNRVWQDTLRLCEDMVRKSPNSGRVRSNLGRAYHERGWTDRAIAEYELALRLNPYLDVPHCNLAFAYREKGMFEKAAYHDSICRFGKRMAAGASAGPRREVRP